MPEHEAVYAIYRFTSKQELGTIGANEVTMDFVKSYRSPGIAMTYTERLKDKSDPNYVWVRVRNLVTGEWIEVN